MAYPVASGQNSLSGIYIPELWNAETIMNFMDATVFEKIANTKYEGTLKKFGDTLHIPIDPTVVSHNYVKGQNLIADQLDVSTITMYIDKGKYTNTQIEDVDVAQSNVDIMGRYTSVAAKQLKIDVDADVLSGIASDISADNMGAAAGVNSGSYNLGTTGAPIGLTTENVVQKITDLGSVLDEQNVPDDGRWLVIPFWTYNKLKNSDLKDVSMTGDGKTPLRTGLVGMIDRFEVYTSNQLPTATDTVTCWDIYAGHPMGLSFAAQVEKSRLIEAEKAFAKLVQTLLVYGYKVTKPEAIARLYCKNSA